MKKQIVLLFFLAVHALSYSQIIGKKASNAVDYIYSGFIEYGVSELKQAANLNDLAAQYYLASCYEYGIVYQKNLEEAFKMYRRTAERGLPDAMFKRASFYKEGIVVSSDIAKSQEWISRYEKKGGKFLLPTFIEIYNEGVKHTENYALNPNAGNVMANGRLVAQQNNSNNTVGSNNHTINNITIVQATSTQPVVQPQNTPQPSKSKSDTDQNIPTTTLSNENAFALIIANENYEDVAKVPNALNDGDVFAEYCKKTLGIPLTNVTLVKDATYNNIKREIKKLSQIAEAYTESAKIIVYYAGHGIPNEVTKDAFLLPVDGFGTDTSTGYSLNELYTTLSRMPVDQVVVFLDACFSGSQRGDGMLASARGVAIKAKPNKIDGKMVVLSAAQGDETAYPYQEEGHGLFTYYLLKKLKETKGDVTLGDLADYIKDNVVKKSLVVNGKQQTPTVQSSAASTDWRNWKLK